LRPRLRIGVDRAADQGLEHIPANLPLLPDAPPNPPEVSQPVGLEHMSATGLVRSHIPDWFVA